MFKTSDQGSFAGVKIIIFLLLPAFLVLISQAVGFCQSQDPDFNYVLEDFEGNFISASEYGYIPSHWEAFGSKVGTFSKGSEAHHGNFCLHAQMTYDPEYYSTIKRVYNASPGTVTDLRIQIKASTDNNAQAMLAASTGSNINEVTSYWYSSSSNDWRTLTLDDVEVPPDGELPITLNLVHTTDSGKTIFELDCLSSSNQLTTPSEPTYDATGKWKITISDCHADTCTIADMEGTVSSTVDQDSKQATLTVSDDGQEIIFTGTANGSDYNLSASWIEDKVTNVDADLLFTLSSDTSGNGALKLFFTKEGESCRGECDVILTKQSSGDEDAGGGDGGGCFIGTASSMTMR